MSEIVEIRKRAHEHMQKGNLESALEEYRKLLKAEDVDPNIYNLMGDVFFKQGNKDEAFRHYNEAVALYKRDSLFSNAIAVCRKIVRLSPDYAEAGRMMGELYLDQGFASEAAGYFLEYAEKMIGRGELSQAAEVLKTVIESAPNAVKAREQLADVYLNLGLLDEARSELVASADIHEQQGDAEIAAAIRVKAESIETVATGAPGEASVEGEGTDRVEIVHKRIGLAHHVPIKIDEVLRSFRDEVRRAIGEEDYRSHYDLGMAYMDMGFYDEALAEFSLAQRKPDLRLRAIEMVGRCFMERDDVELAIEELKAGLEIEGYSQAEYLGLRYNLAMAYEKLGETEEAAKHYEEIVTTDPSFRDARLRRDELSRK